MVLMIAEVSVFVVGFFIFGRVFLSVCRYALPASVEALCACGPSNSAGGFHVLFQTFSSS